MSVFGEQYAAAYDALYEDKDYQVECDLVEQAFVRYAPGRVRSVLDLGCGTGKHATPLSERGYEVVGVDRSPHMLERARAQGPAHGTGARFVLGDIGQLDLGGECFDAALMMFGVLSYQIENTAIRGALSSARRHLSDGALLVCDVWYGPAVLAQRPSERVKVVEADRAQVIRVASSELDTRGDVCTVRYRVWRIEDSRVSEEAREQHTMRYFFEPELRLCLELSGFELLNVSAFPTLDEPPTQDTWNVLVVARAV